MKHILTRFTFTLILSCLALSLLWRSPAFCYLRRRWLLPKGLPDFTPGTYLMGQDPAGNPAIIRVDPNGRLIVYVMADYAGQPTPIAVDSEGRLITMAYGLSGTTPTPIAVDSEGHIIMVPYGVVQVTGDVNATPTTTVRQIQGTDGTTYRTIAVDSEGRIITQVYGMSGTTPTPISVDTAGRIITMAYGMYDTTPKPLATDSQGRLLMVPIDLGGVWGVASPITLSELAIRLGSPKRYDRNGEVLWMDSFWYGTQAWQITVSGGATYKIVTYPARTGGFALACTVGPNSTDNIMIEHREPYLVPTRFGAEISWTYTDNLTAYYFYLGIGTTTDMYTAYVRYVLADKSLQYRNAAGNWVTLQTEVKVIENPYFFNTIKIVTDSQNGKWVKVMLNGYNFDLASQALQSGAPPNWPYISFYVFLDPKPGTYGTVYFDDAIITQNEP